MAPKTEPNGLLHGTLDALVLKTLSWGVRHGYGIARWIEEATDEALAVEEGSLYPALYRMERRGWIEAEWGTSELGRKAKFYRITREGPPPTRGGHRAVGALRRRRVEGSAARMKFGQRLRSRFWRPVVEDEVDAEFAFHVEMRTREYVGHGYDRRAEAREARDPAIRRHQPRQCAHAGRLVKHMDNDMRRTDIGRSLRRT